MGDDLEHSRHNAGFNAQAQAQVDVTDLGHRGIGNHPLGMAFLQGLDAAHNHGQRAQNKQHVGDLQAAHLADVEHPVEDLDQQHDVALQHQAGQDRAGRGGGTSVGVRQPAVEGEQGALDGQAQHHQTHQHGQGLVVQAAHKQAVDALAQLGHEQMAGNGIQQRQADQEQTAAQQAHHQVAHGGHQSLVVVLGHNDGAGGDGVDLDEHVAGEDVVGVQHAQQAGQQHIHHHEVQVLFAGQDVLKNILQTAQQAAGHHDAEHQRQPRFQRAGPQLVAPGRGKLAHGVHKVGILAGSRVQQPGAGSADHGQNGDRDAHCPFAAVQDAGGDTRQHCQENAQKRQIFVKRPHPHTSSRLARMMISSRFRVWYFLYSRWVSARLNAVTLTPTTMPVSTRPVGSGLM